MKKLITILFILALFDNSYSNNQEIKLEFKNLILQTFKYTELNPIYKPESEMIQKKFQDILLKYGKAEYAQEKNTEMVILFNWLHKNSISEYEDSPDYRRMKMRRAFCFASMALNSDSSEAYTFMEYSKLSIIGNIENPDTELLENQYLGVLLIETMLKFEENKLRKSDLLKIEKYVVDNKELLSEKVFLDTKNLITKCNKSLNEKK